MKPNFKVQARKFGNPGPTETIAYDITYFDIKGKEHLMIQGVSFSKELADNFCKAMNEGLQQGWTVPSIMELIALGKEFHKLNKD